MSHTHHMVYLSLLVALSLSLFLLEGLIPLPFPVPGAKLGLANLVTLFAVYALPRVRDALWILLMRILLASFFGGGPSILIFSLSGGLLSFGAMVLLKKSSLFSVPGVSAAGGFFHNLGQLFAAVLVMESPPLWNYLPVLSLCGISVGFFIGCTAHWILKRFQG